MMMMMSSLRSFVCCGVNLDSGNELRERELERDVSFWMTTLTERDVSSFCEKSMCVSLLVWCC